MAEVRRKLESVTKEILELTSVWDAESMKKVLQFQMLDSLMALLKMKQLPLAVTTESIAETSEEESIDFDTQKLQKLLNELPCSSAREDAIIMTDLHLLISQFPWNSSAIFSEFYWPIDRLLNPISIKRACSDATLQSDLVSILEIVTKCNLDAARKMVQDYTAVVMPFIIKCLRSQTNQICESSVVTVREWALLLLDSDRKIMGESGIIKPLIEVIQEEGGLVNESNAVTALFCLCSRVVENRQHAITDGAVNVLIGKIKRRWLEESMLQVLNELSEGPEERVTVQLEEADMIRCLFMIMVEDDRTQKCKEFCVNIICNMSCAESDSKKIKEVENVHQILEGIILSGTSKAADKARELLTKL